MHCERCGGFMAQYRPELLDDTDQLSIRAWRCRGCGDLIEEIRICPRPTDRARRSDAARADEHTHEYQPQVPHNHMD